MKKVWIIVLSIVIIILIVWLVNKYLFTKKISPNIGYGTTIPPIIKNVPTNQNLGVTAII